MLSADYLPRTLKNLKVVDVFARFLLKSDACPPVKLFYSFF